MLNPPSDGPRIKINDVWDDLADFIEQQQGTIARLLYRVSLLEKHVEDLDKLQWETVAQLATADQHQAIKLATLRRSSDD